MLHKTLLFCSVAAATISVIVKDTHTIKFQCILIYFRSFQLPLLHVIALMKCMKKKSKVQNKNSAMILIYHKRLHSKTLMICKSVIAHLHIYTLTLTVHPVSEVQESPLHYGDSREGTLYIHFVYIHLFIYDLYMKKTNKTTEKPA